MNEDFNGGDVEGFGVYPTTTYNGHRSSTSRCFLGPIGDRPNLDILTSTLTHRCLIDNGNNCFGIEVSHSSRLRKSKRTRKIFAKEVILSGGAINTPQLLLLSGIGPKNELKAAGVDCKLHLPGVGKNLQDHLQFIITYNCRQSVSLIKLQATAPYEFMKWMRDPKLSPILGTSPIPVGGFGKLSPDDPIPNYQHHFVATHLQDHGRKPSFKHRFDSHICTLQQLSKGEIKLKSNNPFEPPVIDPMSLSDEQDLADLVVAFKHSRKVFNQPALDAFNGGEHSPGNNIQTDDDIAHWLRHNLETCYHPTCTARIGPDDMSVCDTDFKVKGISGLRVADASVMPDLISGNTNAPTMMLAEMCALEIKQ